jgi:hypothetical protein
MTPFFERDDKILQWLNAKGYLGTAYDAMNRYVKDYSGIVDGTLFDHLSAALTRAGYVGTINDQLTTMFQFKTTKNNRRDAEREFFENTSLSMFDGYWFTRDEFKLNGVLPDLIHQYSNNRFWNSSDGETTNPFTTVRTTNATMWDSQGRLVFAPANMLTRSNLLTSGGWSKNACVATAVTDVSSPTLDGVFKLVVDDTFSTTGNDAVGGMWQLLSGFASNTPVCYSFYAKAGEITAVRVREQITTGARILVDLIDGSATYELGNSTQMQLNTVGCADGWWRINVTYIVGPVATTTNFAIKPGITTGDGVSGIYVSSPQQELWGIDSPKAYVSTGSSTSGKYMERIAYSPTDLSLRGFQIEGACTNLIAKSASNVPADWTSSFITMTAGTSAWNQPVSRATVNSTGGAQFTYITSSTVTPAASTAYTASGFLKKGNVSIIQITVSNNHLGGGEAYLNYNFDTNTLNLLGSSAIANTAYAEILQDGWVRLQFSFTTGGAPAAGAGFVIGFVDTISSPRLATGSTNGAYVDAFGFQYEIYQTATSYVPTYGVSATRAADNTLLSSVPWYNQDGGVMYAEFTPNKNDPTNLKRIFSISDGTTSNRVQIARSSSGTTSAVTTLAGVSEFSPNSGSLSTNFSRTKTALLFEVGNKRITVNGNNVNSNAGTAVPSSGLTVANVGHLDGFTNANSIGAWINEIRYYSDKTASDAQLQTLTTL